MSSKNRRFWVGWRGTLAASGTAGLIAVGIVVPAMATSPTPTPPPAPPSPNSQLQEGPPAQAPAPGDKGDESGQSAAFGAVDTDLTLSSVKVISENLNDTNAEYVQFTFSRTIIDVANPHGFVLVGFDSDTMIKSQTAQIVHDNPDSVLVGYQPGTDVKAYSLAQIASGVVQNEAGRTNMPTSVPLADGQAVDAVAMPLLTAVDANSTLNQVTYHFDRNLDAKSANAADLGFYTLDGRMVTATSIVTGDLNTVIAQFDHQVQDAVRYFAQAGAVTDDRGVTNPASAIGAPTTAPDLTAVSELIGNTQFEFTFDQPVQNVNAENFSVYTPDGTQVKGASAVQPAPNVVRVAFPAIQEYGQSVTLATVHPDAVASNDGSATGNTIGLHTVGHAVGVTAGPALQGVVIDPTTGQIRYVFNKVVDDNEAYDPADFALITAAGDVVPARGFVGVDGNSVLMIFDAAAVKAAHAVTVSSGAVQDFQGDTNPLDNTVM